MIGPEERLMALGVPAETAREMVRIFGGGSGGTPLLAANNLSDLPNVQAALINLGLGALAQQSAVVTQQSSTVTPSGAGTVDSPLQASVRVSADPDNVLVVESDGLRVPASSSGIPEAPDDGSVYGRGNDAWQQLGSAALADTADFATAAQGAAADTAVQPGDLGTAAYQDITAFATALQGSKADSAVQPGDLAPVATSGSYDDLEDKPTIPTSPGGDFVGTTAEQTLTNKTLGTGSKESVTVASTITINDAAAPFQQITLTANATATINLSVGVSRTIWLNPGTYTVTWPAGTVLVGDIENLPASKWSLITFTGMPSNTAGVAALVASQP